MKSNKIHGLHVFFGLLLAVLFLAMIPSCTHEAVMPVDPGPIDPGGNPIDTTGNGGNNGGTPCDPNVVYFNVEVLPLLRSNCAKSGCHDAATHEEGIVMDSYQSIMNSDIVDAYDLDDSDLYEVITENDHDKIMPPPPNQPLTSAQIALIADWILQGAQDLTCDEAGTGCNTDNVSYTGFIAPLLTTYCTGCHSGPAASDGVTLNTLAGVQSVAMSGRLIGALTWATGYTPMPLGATSKLPQCSIDKIQAWINDGTPNN